MSLNGTDSGLGSHKVKNHRGGGGDGRPQMAEIDVTGTAGAGTRKATIHRSLLISPNLDALLEHEERRRGPPSAELRQLQPTAQHATTGALADISVGLPPPPRRPGSHRTRRRGMDRTTAGATTDIDSGSGQGSAAGKKTRSAGAATQYHSSEGSEGSVVGENEDNFSAPGSPEPRSQLSNGSPGMAVHGPDVGRENRGRNGGPLGPTTKAASLLGAGTSSSVSNPYINPAPEPMLIGYNNEAGQGQRMQTTSIMQVQQDREGRDMDEKALPMPPDQGVVCGGNGLSNPWRRRPLLSHGHQSSISSSDSASTHGPPSTEEHGPRISISSTIYPPSDNYDPYHHHPDMDDDYIHVHPPAQVSPPAVQPAALVVDNDPKPPKPPLPTTPKPSFTRSLTPKGLLTRSSSLKAASQPSLPFTSRSKENAAPLPPTTNFLDIEERADLIRKSRKLARVFGETPGSDAMAQQESGRSPYHQFTKPFGPNSSVDDTHTPKLPPSSWRQVPDSPLFVSIRRHSVPIAPDDVSFISMASPTNESLLASEFHVENDSDRRVQPSSCSNNKHRRRPGSPTSFMDFSDDNPEDPAVPPSSPKSSTFTISSDTATLSDPLEDDRRRKRERLAKLHRFLGSHVPANLVLGIDDPEASLPPIRPISVPPPTSPSDYEEGRKRWRGRRRSSSAAMLIQQVKDVERLKEDLDEREKAINVRRAQKMEKVFGVAPPQTLYHTRHSPSPSIPRATSLLPGPLVGLSFAPELEPVPSNQRNPNRGSYIKPSSNGSNGARASKKPARPGTAESSKQLIDKGQESYGFDERFLPVSESTRHSLIYNHYQHSLNSLNDMMDRDDKESLAELHHYLHGGANLTCSTLEDAQPSPTTTTPRAAAPGERRPSHSSSHKSERRRSLPARTSTISMASECSASITSPKADASSFQTRRRRAAKLAQFFGVNYRELIGEVLESLESGVEQEHRRGTLRAAEVEDLLAKLRSLKAKRQSYV